ncbi:MAG: hypothetical protein JJ910_00485 [Maricaulis sp.]|nr:hypothetical protein [Maricaulis sp.]
MRNALIATTSLLGATLLSGCVIVVGDDDAKLHYGAETRHDGYLVLDRNGDFSRIGGDIDLRGQLGGGVSIAAGDVDFSGRVAEDVSIAGGDVNFTAIGEEDVDIAAGDLFVSGRVGRDGSFAAGEMLIEAAIGRDLNAHADHMIIRSTVDGEVELVAAKEIRRRRRDDPEHGLIVMGGDFREGGDVCGITIEFEPGASIGAPMTVWAESQPNLSGVRGSSNISYIPRDGVDCDELIEG